MASKNGSDIHDHDENRSVEGSHTSKKGTVGASLVESKALHTSILNFDPSHPKRIDSPRSLKAMSLLYISEDQLHFKGKNFFKSTAINGKDLDRLVQKDERAVKCFIDQVKRKRKEVIQTEKKSEELSMKHRSEQEKMMRKLQLQSERAEKIKHEIEAQNAQEVERKLEERYRKIKGGEDESPYFEQYNNLTYVPKPKEYFKLNAMNQSIKQRLDLSKNKIDLIKHKQLHEMGHMIDYEINLQHIKKKNEEGHKQKVKHLKSVENFKKKRFEKNMEILEDHDRKYHIQKKMEEMIREENKRRLMKMNEREANIRLQKVMEHEHRAKLMKQSEQDYEQNRKYMVKQLIGDFKELKNNQLSAEEVSQKYAYLRDEEAFEKAMADLNHRRHLKTEKVKGEEEARGKSAMTRGGHSVSMNNMRNISSAVSKEETSPVVHLPQAEGHKAIDWDEQRKLLRKRQNEEMMRLVEEIEKEETERKKILADCKNEEEQLKLRQKFIEKKAESQKKVKKLMERHKKEAEYIDKEELNEQLKASKQKELEDHGDPHENEGEEEQGEDED